MSHSKAEVAASKFPRLPTGIDGFFNGITGDGFSSNCIPIFIGDTGTGNFDLMAILSIVTTKARAINAKISAFDSLAARSGLLTAPVTLRRECHRLRDWLRQSDSPRIITLRRRSDRAHNIRAYEHFTNVMRYLTGCVIVLRHGVIARVSMRELRILTDRHSRAWMPYA